MWIVRLTQRVQQLRANLDNGIGKRLHWDAMLRIEAVVPVSDFCRKVADEVSTLIADANSVALF